MFIACSIMYRKKAIHRTEIERSLLAAKGFNTNLVQFLNFYVLFLCASALLRAPKTVLRARNLLHEKL